LSVGRGANNASPWKNSLLRNVTQGIGIGWNFWNDEGSGKRNKVASLWAVCIWLRIWTTEYGDESSGSIGGVDFLGS
jgi:hypothetical protein